MSGWQDSNLRPPAPKAGTLTGLCYTPSTVLASDKIKRGCKARIFNDIFSTSCKKFMVN